MAASTRAEFDKRVDRCAELLANGLHDGQIKRVMANEFGCEPRSAWRYLKCARQRICESTGKTRAQLQAESVAFYQSIRANESIPLQQRLQASKQLDYCLGLHHGTIDVSVAAAAPAAVDLSKLSADELATLSTLHDKAKRVKLITAEPA